MSMFRLNVNCNNAAFVCNDGENTTPQSAASELGRILRKIARDIENGSVDYSYFQTIHDINGNDVGRYALKNE